MEWRTVEVRWFQSGACPDSVAAWFHAGVRVSEAEHRTDAYAPLGRPDLGIKRRGANLLDLKVRTAQLHELALPAGLVGYAEAWTKWSFPLDARQPLDMAWLPVEKTRWTRRYEVIDGETRPIALNQLVPAGCAAELAVLRVGPSEAWSLGFEAFGEGDIAEMLTAGARSFVAETPLGELRFDRNASGSYPSWLCDPSSFEAS